MSEVLAVIVGYRNSRLTIQAAQSLSDQKLPVKIVVWDNFSNEIERKVLVEAVELRQSSPLIAFPDGTNVVMCPDNIMWSPAINTAVDLFLEDQSFLLFMNNDCSLPPGTLASLLDAFEQRADAGMVGPLIPAIGGPNEPTAHRTETEPVRVPYLMGACTLMLRSVWDQLIERDGYGLDPRLPLGADDHDLSLRIKHLGYGLYVDPRVEARHKGHASVGSNEWDIWGPRSWAWFNEKWANYFKDEEEALNCHWGGRYVPGWERGSGLTEEQFVRSMNRVPL